MIYLYGIVDDISVDPSRFTGLDGAPVGMIACDSIAAVVSDTPRGRIEPEAELLWQHEHVVEKLMGACGVLPARFGVLLRDANAMQVQLRERYAEFVNALGRVRGRLELSVRILYDLGEGEPASRPAPISPPVTNGREYLLRRFEQVRAEHERREKGRMLALEMHADLTRFASDSVYQIWRTPRLLLSAAYLVDANGTHPFRDRVAELASRHAGLRLLCTGPWPAYNFSTRPQAPQSHFPEASSEAHHAAR